MKIFDNNIFQFVCCIQSLEQKVDILFNSPWFCGGVTVGGGD